MTSVFFSIKLIIITLQAYKMAQPQFTTAQRVFIVNVCRDTGSLVQTQQQQRFRNRFPEVRVPAKSTMRDKFQRFGTVLNLLTRCAQGIQGQHVTRQCCPCSASYSAKPISARRNPLHMDKSSFNRITCELRFHPYH